MRNEHRPLLNWLRGSTLVALAALGLAGIVGSGGGGIGLPSDCPPGYNCNQPVPPDPVIQPAYVTAQVGTPVVFSATVNVAGPQITYQWLRSSDGGAHFVEIAGATSATLSLASVNLGDDGAIFMVTVVANGLNGSGVSHLAVSASPGLVFADGEFQTSDWLATPLANGNTPAPAHTEEQVPTGGNPGAYRKMVFQLAPQAYTGTVVYTSLLAAYEPQTQGAVYVIDYSEDGISPQASTFKTTRSAMLLEQSGRRYAANLQDSYLRIATFWGESDRSVSMHAQDFNLIDGPACQAGESCPDFSALGAPMRFGYWRISSGAQGDSIAHGIDNWKVTVWRR